MSKPPQKPVLIVTGDFTPLGGMDAGNLALAQYFARLPEWELHLVAHRVWPDLLQTNSVKFHRVPRLLNSNLLSAPLLALVGQSWGRKTLARSGRVIVNGGNCAVPDVNWVHYVHSACEPQLQGSALFRWRSGLAHRGYRRNEQDIIPAARTVITNSERTRRDVLALLRAIPERVHTIFYGCDPERFKPATGPEKMAARQALGWEADRTIALFIGALGDRRKGFDLLFEAWTKLCGDQDWDASLAVVGAGAELSQWRQRAEQTGLGSRIQFLGFRQDVPTIIQAGDLLVHPARYEAYGLAVQEALCCGLPALVSADAGVAERYGPELRELLLPTPLTAAGIELGLRNWNANRVELKRKVLKLSESLRSHTWDEMAREFVRFL